MRTIKFRGKSIHGLNPMITGYLIKNDCDISFIVIDDIHSGWNKCEVFDETIGQFTGLTDKHGKEVYEGDILGTGHLDFKCNVTFEDGCFQLKTNQ